MEHKSDEVAETNAGGADRTRPLAGKHKEGGEAVGERKHRDEGGGRHTLGDMER